MTTLQQLSDAQANPEVVVNENFETVSAVGIFGKRQPATSGLTWGYYGGLYGSTSIADGTVTLTGSATNHVVINRSTGAVSVSTTTTNWNNTSTYGRLYKVTTSVSAVTSIEDHRFGNTGIFGNSGGSIGSLNDLSDVDLSGSPGPSDGNVLTYDAYLSVWVAGPAGGAGDQSAIQFKDEGTNIGGLGTVTSVNFTGAGVTASAAAGAVTVNIPGGGGGGTIGRHMLPIQAANMMPATSSPCGTLAQINPGAGGQPDFSYLPFDATTVEYAVFSIEMPESWDEGTVTFIPVWSHGATATNFGVVWQLQAVAVSNDDTLLISFGTAQSSTDTGGTTDDLYKGPESSAITIAGTPSAGDTVYFRLNRLPTDAADTLAIDARLHGIRLYFTTAAETD